MSSDLAVRLLKKERQTLERIISKSKNDLRKVPAGSVHIRKHKNGLQFYYHPDPNDKEEGQKREIYMPVKERKTAISLVRKQYLLRLLDAAEQQLAGIDSFLQRYDPRTLQNIFLEETPARR